MSTSLAQNQVFSGCWTVYLRSSKASDLSNDQKSKVANTNSLVSSCRQFEELRYPEGSWSRAAALAWQNEPAEVVWASGMDASWQPPFGGFPGTDNCEDTRGKPRRLERLYMSSGLGTPRNPPEVTGKYGSGVCCHRDPTSDKQRALNG